MPPSRSRSQSRHRVDRSQRCRMLRRFHKHLADLPDSERDKSNMHLFTDTMLDIIDSLIGDDDWETVPEGEDSFSDNWWNSRSLITQLSHVRKWYDEKAANQEPLLASNPTPDNDAAASGATEAHPPGAEGETAETEVGSSDAAATITNDAARVTNDAAPSPSNIESDLAVMLNQQDRPAASPLRSSPAWWDSGKASGRQAAQPAIARPLITQRPTNRPAVTGPPADQLPANQLPANQPLANQPLANQPPANQPPANQPPANQPPANQPSVTDELSPEEEAALEPLRKELRKAQAEYDKIPKEYHDWLEARQAVALAHRLFREAEKRCKSAEGKVSTAERHLAEADQRLRGATLDVFQLLGAAPTDGDQGRLSTSSLTGAQRKMLDDANEAAHRAANGDIEGVVSGVARLNLNRREIKEERNGLYDSLSLYIRAHQTLYDDMSKKEAAFKAAEKKREAAWERFVRVRGTFR